MQKVAFICNTSCAEELLQTEKEKILYCNKPLPDGSYREKYRYIITDGDQTDYGFIKHHLLFNFKDEYYDRVEYLCAEDSDLSPEYIAKLLIMQYRYTATELMATLNIFYGNYIYSPIKKCSNALLNSNSDGQVTIHLCADILLCADYDEDLMSIYLDTLQFIRQNWALPMFNRYISNHPYHMLIIKDYRFIIKSTADYQNIEIAYADRPGIDDLSFSKEPECRLHVYHVTTNYISRFYLCDKDLTDQLQPIWLKYVFL